jgi:hypothetical protein
MRDDGGGLLRRAGARGRELAKVAGRAVVAGFLLFPSALVLFGLARALKAGGRKGLHRG